MTALPIHPRTGLRAVFVSERTGRIYWPILGGSGPGDGGAGDGTDAGAGTGTGTGTATKAAREWTPPADADEYNRIIEDRLERERRKYGMTPEEAREAKDRLDALDLDLASDVERATREGTDAGYSAAMGALVPRLVRAEFKAEAKGILNDDQLDGLLEDLDLTRYCDDDGEPDIEKIQAKIAKIAPGTSLAGKSGGGSARINPPRDLGQGTRKAATPTPGEAGRAEAARRFPKK